MSRTVLVTGATGYIARHVVARLLAAGDAVVGTTRDAARHDEMVAALSPALPDAHALERYRTIPLDLTSDDGWDAAMQGVDALIHTASPFPMATPRDPQEIIAPAVDGARRALGAAARAGVRDVVLTSSFAAIGGRPEDGRRYDEGDWTDGDDPRVPAYSRSKTLAERAAWEIADREGLRLRVINPSLVLGAPLGDDYGTSVGLVRRILTRRDPALPRAGFLCCDVGDVAEAHVRALDRDAAIGGRHLIAERFLWFSDFARLISEAVPEARPPTRIAPKWLLRALAVFDSSIRQVVDSYGIRFEADTTRLAEVLGIEQKDARASVRETALWLKGRGLG